MVSISVTDAWWRVHAGAIIGILEISGIDNSIVSTRLNGQKKEIESKLRDTYHASSRKDILANPVMSAYSAYYKQFRKTYHILLQVESIVFKGKDLPAITPLVDANFMAEMETFVLSAGHDLKDLKEPLLLDVSLENEFIDQLNGTSITILAGDMIMRDSDAVSCSIIYGQDDRSPIMRNTTHALYVAYAPPGVLEEQVENHLLTIEKYIHHFATECIIEQRRLFYADGFGRDSNNESNDET